MRFSAWISDVCSSDPVGSACFDWSATRRFSIAAADRDRDFESARHLLVVELRAQLARQAFEHAAVAFLDRDLERVAGDEGGGADAQDRAAFGLVGARGDADLSIGRARHRPPYGPG